MISLRFSTISSSRQYPTGFVDVNECLSTAIENLGSSITESGQSSSMARSRRLALTAPASFSCFRI